MRSKQIYPRGPRKDDISGADERCPAETRLNKGSAGSVGQRDCLTLRNRAQTRLEMFCWPPAPQGRQPQPAAQARLRRWLQAGAERRPLCPSPRWPFFPSPSSVPSPCVCPLGAGLRLQRPSCDQKGVTEPRRQKFGTERGAVIFNTGLPPVMDRLLRAEDRPGNSWVLRAQHGA